MSELKRAIDLRGAIAINVITMIGIGPLVTIPLVIAALGGPLALVGWIGGAVVALCDGLVWAELSSRFPGSGGTYVYLRNAFGPDRLGRALAFLFNWQFLLYAPCLLASGYVGFANYAAYLYPQLGASAPAHDAVAIGAGVVTIALLYRRTSQVAVVGMILAAAAAATIALVAVAGLTHADFRHAFAFAQPLRFGAGFLAGFGTALFITLYDYVGYADAALLGDEVIRPQRTIPAAIVLSVILVAALYILLQLGVLGAIPWRSLLDVHGQPTTASQYVGALVVERSWGRSAAVGVTVLVLVTAFASLYGNLLGFSRIPFAAARDGAFLAAFGRLHPRKGIPHVALLAVGALSLVASLFTLDQVIAFLTAGIVLIQGIAQIGALALLRARRAPAPFRMPFYPVPALVALIGWALAFVSAGAGAIALGVGWLAAGVLVFLLAARRHRWWPFAFAALIALGMPAMARAADARADWRHWATSRIAFDHGYPVLTVRGNPFFVYGAAFFYERVSRARWRQALLGYRALGINTLDVYLIWNWHEPAPGVSDFTGRTNPQRDLVGLLRLAHELGFRLILRPGPVIRNEWRNGGYPPWLLARAAYDMPLHDVLTGRYPATATLQNAHADAAGAEWLGNATHLRYAGGWLRDVLRVVRPYASDVIAIALDDDQGAYLDNDTWPAPHWRAYVGWLRSTVRSVVGPRVPLFINTYEMRVTAASPAWAWGDWYQTSGDRLDAHDLADLDFATGLLLTQPRVPAMQAEFQAGWLQAADEGAPRPSDPANTALALSELLRDGVHGIVNFPLQDTIDPDGWEAPWANWSYAWNAALTVDLRRSSRYAPTAAFGTMIRRYGPLLARTHIAAAAAIVWPPSLFTPGALTNDDFTAFADATIAMQRSCNARGFSCPLVDLRYADDATLRRYPALLLPLAVPARLQARMDPRAHARLALLRSAGRLVADPSLLAVRGGIAFAPDTTLLIADDGSYGFIDAVNISGSARRIGPLRLMIARHATVVPAFAVAARGVRLIPVRLWGKFPSRPAAGATPPPFRDDGASVLVNGRLRVAFAPNAGARIAELGDGSGNVATSIGLLRDAVDPQAPPSARDYIAQYTHPMPAGTFNRSYGCSIDRTASAQTAHCSYDAPDVPAGGGRFERTLTLERNGEELIVDERFTAAEPASPARLVSISGFSFLAGDGIVTSADRDALGILHGRRMAWLRWNRGEVARIETRQTRGAELIGIVFNRAAVRLRLGIFTVSNAAEAQRRLDAN